MADYTIYTEGTPNGTKIGIVAEELGLKYENKILDMMKREMKEPWFVKINPNGRIPVLVDHSNADFSVMESGAILIYLAEKYGKFLPKEPNARSACFQWLMFQMAGQGPMQGQANHFMLFTKEDVPYGKKRYHEESIRLYTVLNNALEGQEYIAGEYSIADMALWGWAYFAPAAGIDLDDFSNVKVPWVEEKARKEFAAAQKAKLVAAA